MTYELHRHDARHISTLLAPDSVDLIVTSPPYFALRSYRDGGEHYDGQLGSEPTPGEFVDALIACTADWMKVLKPGGSLWVNLGDKYAGSGGHNNAALSNWHTAPLAGGRGRLPELSENQRGAADKQAATRRNAPDRYNQSSDGIRAKSLMGLPWRYAIRCIDELGLILRAEVIWSKPNGLPESVTDRVRRSHEQWFHFTREGRYFAAIDEVREPHIHAANFAVFGGTKAVGATDLVGASGRRQGHNTYDTLNPLGKAPGSVWSIPSEPLQVPDDLGVDHFAAFPSELPRRIILGWSPTGYCTVCDEPRRATYATVGESTWARLKREGGGNGRDLNPVSSVPGNLTGGQTRDVSGQVPTFVAAPRSFTGYLCACPTPDAPTRPAVVLDPFNGTGTVPAVAHLLGRHGIGTDLSNDYLRLAEWRCSNDQRLRDKVLDRSGIPNPDPPAINGQMDLFGGVA